jgi:4-diphosphocytidyl-2-C-methyl-D-erythritol kinase
LRLLAPAKINLFLHVVGQRPDGYHLLQSAFELIDWADHLLLTPRVDGTIARVGDLLCEVKDDLAYRAALALQATPAWAQVGSPGVVIAVKKEIPAGAGLGGGSSDAASVLLGLNRLWGLGLSQQALAEIGLGLGADVPFFLFGRPAFAQGIGEQLAAYNSRRRWVVVAVPPSPVSTALIFQAPELTRNSKPLKIADFAQAALNPVWDFGRNDLEPVTCGHFPEVAQILQHLKEAAVSEAVTPDAVRMSGSGGAVFCTAPSQEKALAILNRMVRVQRTPEGRAIAHLKVCQTLMSHPEQQES